MRLVTTALAGIYLSACAAPPTRPPLAHVLVITGAVILAGAIVEHRQANHLVPANDPKNEATKALSCSPVPPGCDTTIDAAGSEHLGTE
jgi:hypothetical protein